MRRPPWREARRQCAPLATTPPWSYDQPDRPREASADAIEVRWREDAPLLEKRSAADRLHELRDEVSGTQRDMSPRFKLPRKTTTPARLPPSNTPESHTSPGA